MVTRGSSVNAAGLSVAAVARWLQRARTRIEEREREHSGGTATPDGQADSRTFKKGGTREQKSNLQCENTELEVAVNSGWRDVRISSYEQISSQSSFHPPGIEPYF
ncbi:uncharacterized protein LOC122570492 [Bombus pyrosoma]|uniref:uncharacterized protein LOC122570492 n=1 Tax=Bombus pyrosoma TaxID=396416 RepID=UPI001CB9B3D1|nr:uncharacterized protein LOC122570492 [Bombus pyrosoma]